MYSFNAKNATAACIKWIQDWFIHNGNGCNAVIGISGGKDSTVVAALCAKALGPDRVIGVMLPNGKQSDIQDSKDIIAHLGIIGIELNISSTIEALTESMQLTMLKGLNDPRLSAIKSMPEITQQGRENLPPRIRMSSLYLVAQCFNGRVSNNCNLSENWVGYSTIYGDTAGDFSPISNFTVGEVIQIGRELGVPEKFLVKPPSDGLCGKTDEDKLGFTYEVLDRYLRTGEIDNSETKKRIDDMHLRNRFKHEPMAAFSYNSRWCKIHGLVGNRL